jgi:hypothetical protein
MSGIFWQLLATGSTVFSTEFLMVLSGFEFRLGKESHNKLRMSYGFFITELKIN